MTRKLYRFLVFVNNLHTSCNCSVRLSVLTNNICLLVTDNLRKLPPNNRLPDIKVSYPSIQFKIHIRKPITNLISTTPSLHHRAVSRDGRYIFRPAEMSFMANNFPRPSSLNPGCKWMLREELSTIMSSDSWQSSSSVFTGSTHMSIVYASIR